MALPQCLTGTFKTCGPALAVDSGPLPEVEEFKRHPSVSTVVEGRAAMHSDQLNIDVTTARKLIYEQFPQFRGEEVVALESVGTANAIFRIGSEHVARFPLRVFDHAEAAIY